MYEVVLLSSFHMQLGKCNPLELYRIIEKIQPEVIFVELPLDIFDLIFIKGHIPRSVEAIAIKEYARKNEVKLHPVDTLEKNLEDLFDGYEVIQKNNSEYAGLVNKQAHRIKQFGYAYINSPECSELSKRIQHVEEETLLNVKDPILINKFKLMKEMHHIREAIMLENIYQYSKNNRFGRALFICGVEHRKPIIKAVSEREKNRKGDLSWSYYMNSNFKLPNENLD